MKKRQLLFWILWIIAICLMAFVIPIPSGASSISELQSEIDALEEKNRVLQAEIDAIQSQYDTTYGEMSEIVAKKNAIDQEISLLNEKLLLPMSRSQHISNSSLIHRMSWILLSLHLMD